MLLIFVCHNATITAKAVAIEPIAVKIALNISQKLSSSMD